MTGIAPDSPENYEFKFKKYASYDLENASIYENLKKVRSSFFYQKDMTNIFILAMTLGFQKNIFVQVRKPSNSIPTYVFTKQEKWMMIAIYMKTKRQNV